MSWVEISEHDTAKELSLWQFMTLPHGIPSHHTCFQEFVSLDLEQLGTRFGLCTAAIVQPTVELVVVLPLVWRCAVLIAKPASRRPCIR